MLSFFKINDPYRLISIFIILAIFRMPAFIGDLPLTVPELNWMIVGEKISGGALMYMDIWDNLAPLSAVVYGLVDAFFGKSSLAYSIISILLVTFQSYIFNAFLINNKAYKDSTYVPALVYALLMNGFFDFYTLSPVLMGITFLLPAFGHIFHQVESKEQNLSMLPTGLYIGLASMFYLPCFIFIVPALLSFLLFTGTTPRNYLLFIYGFFAPILIIAFYFFWFDGLQVFYQNFILGSLMLAGRNLLPLKDFLFISSLTIIFTALSLFKIFEASRYTHYQVRYQQITFFMFLGAAASWFFSSTKAPYQMIIFVPAIAFFISHYFLLIRRKMLSEGLFLLLFIFLLLVNYGSIYHFRFPSQFIHHDKILVKPTVWDELVKGKSILFLGDNISVYKNSRLSTPFLNWKIASLYFSQPDFYDNLAEIYLRLKEDMPEVIIDDEGVYDRVFNKMPTLKAQYERGKLPDTYILKKLNN